MFVLNIVHVVKKVINLSNIGVLNVQLLKMFVDHVSEDLRRVLRFFTENSSSNRNNNPTNMNDSNSNLPDDEQSTNPSNHNSVSENGIIPTESNINDNANIKGDRTKLLKKIKNKKRSIDKVKDEKKYKY